SATTSCQQITATTYCSANHRGTRAVRAGALDADCRDVDREVCSTRCWYRDGNHGAGVHRILHSRPFAEVGEGGGLVLAVLCWNLDRRSAAKEIRVTRPMDLCGRIGGR